MSTSHHTTAITSRKQTVKTGALSAWFGKQAEAFERSRFALMAIYITIQSCLGSIACMYILQHPANELPLSLCAAVAMGSNAVFIAQAEARWCLGAFYLSLLVHTSLIVLYC